MRKAKVKMAKNDFKGDLKIHSIELINSSIVTPLSSTASITNFTYKMSIESKIDTVKKLIFVTIDVQISDTEQSLLVGSIRVSCIYSLSNFDEFIIQISNEKLEIPPPLVDLLNSISISTTRGVMFSIFKGTYLHNAVLPIINTEQLLPSLEFIE